MSSRDTPGVKASPTDPPPRQIAPSRETSVGFSNGAHLDLLLSRARSTETNRLRSLLSWLGCIEGPADSFRSIKTFEQENRARLFGYFDGRMFYLPDATPTATLHEAAASLETVESDTGEMRRLLADLWLSTKHERMADADRDAMLVLFVRRLAAYPKPVVLAVLANLNETAEWFPKWAELQAQLAPLCGWRTAMRTALRNQYLKRQKRNDEQ